MQSLSPDRARRLRSFFDEVGFSSSGILDRLGIWSPPIPGSPGYDRIEATLDAPEPFSVLGRLFLLGRPVSSAVLGAALPEDVSRVLFETGLVDSSDENVMASVVLAPYESLWLISDHFDWVRGPRRREAMDHVLGVNPVARALLRFTRRDHVARTLDLGAGGGIQGLLAARHSRHVWVTDVNDRAVDFSRFNAWLNGIENVTALAGDTYAPVQGERFDLIVCNPPFILSPSRKLVCYDNEFELDGYCREIIRRTPEHLEIGGCLQMVLEWVEIAEQPWQERLGGWLTELGCDAWVLKANTLRPESYADLRMEEMRQATPEEVPPAAEWMRYYREHEVRAIHGGLLLLRNPGPVNRPLWIRFQELSASIDDRAGASVSAALRRFDFIVDARDQILEQRLELDPRARLDQEHSRSDARWQAVSTTLRIPVGLPIEQSVQPSMADFVVRFDGRETVSGHIARLATEVGRTPAELEEECLRIVWHLLERGFLIPA